MNGKVFSIVASVSVAAGMLGGALGYGVASAAGYMGFPTATKWAPITSTLTEYVIPPSYLKAIRVTGTNIDYWFIDQKTKREAIVRIPVRVEIGTLPNIKQ